MALKVWLPLNGKFDNQGCTDNNVIIDGSVPFANGKIGQAASFVSATAANRVRVPGLELTTLSVCAWFMSPSAVSAASCIINEGRDYNTLGWRMYITSTNKISLNCANTAFNTMNCVANTWYHACITFGNGVVKYYINGELKSSVSTTALPDYSESNGFINVGAFGYSVNNTFIYPFNGYINDIRIYDEVLSDRQIKEIAKGLCAHYKLEGVGANKNLLTNSHVENRNHSSTSYPCAAYPLESAVTANKKYTVSVNATFTDAYVIGLYFGGGSYGTQWVNCSQNGTYTLSWTFTANSNMAAQNFVNVYVRDSDNTPKIGIAKCIVHWVKLEEGEIVTPWIPNEADALYTKLGYDKALTTDVSGFGYNGTITGELTFDSDSPRYAGSTKFNGSSYITTIPGSLAWCNFDNLTISTWMKPTVKPGGWTGSIGIQQDGGTNGKVFSISNYAGNFSVHTDNGSGWVTTQSETLPLNQWSHCVATLTDGTNLKMYINGKLVKTATINYNTATVLSDTRIAIGVDLPGDDEKYTGFYSDARFYSTALSAEDILKLYEISGIIDNKGNTYSYEFIEED